LLSVEAGYAPAAEQQVAYADYPVVAALHPVDAELHPAFAALYPVVAALDAPADGTQHVISVRVGLMAHNAAVCLSADCFFPYDYTSRWVDGGYSQTGNDSDSGNDLDYYAVKDLLKAVRSVFFPPHVPNDSVFCWKPLPEVCHD